VYADDVMLMIYLIKDDHRSNYVLVVYGAKNECDGEVVSSLRLIARVEWVSQFEIRLNLA
jgi:hypothetical protein